MSIDFTANVHISSTTFIFPYSDNYKILTIHLDTILRKGVKNILRYCNISNCFFLPACNPGRKLFTSCLFVVFSDKCIDQTLCTVV